MVLSSLFAIVEKGGSATGGDAMINSYLKKTLGVLRTSCSSLEEFEALWNSSVFSGCRHFYEPLLSKCPAVQDELFIALPTDVQLETVSAQKKETETAAVNVKTQDNTLDAGAEDTGPGEHAADVPIQSEVTDNKPTTEDSNGSVAKPESEVSLETNAGVKPDTASSNTEDKLEEAGTTEASVEAPENMAQKEPVEDVEATVMEQEDGKVEAQAAVEEEATQ
eukprot:jgi/Phyca11/510850/fgenesh2_kg.PHYCAscaffold_68_\